jgi:hypothetical protein
MKNYILIFLCVLNLTTKAQQWEWAKSVYGEAIEQIDCSVVDDYGNLYVAGRYTDSSLTFCSAIITRQSTGYDLFVSKYDPNGNCIWTKSFSSVLVGYGVMMTKDVNGNIYVAGDFSSQTITFGTFTLVNDPLYGDNMFLTKFNSNGDVLWAIQAGGNSVEYISSVSTDASGNTFILGSFLSPTITLGSTVLHNSGSSNIFFTKVTPQGNFLWAKSIGSYHNTSSSSFVSPFQITNDNLGNFYMTGFFTDSICIVENDILVKSNAGYGESFMIKYSTNGTKLSSKTLGYLDISALSFDVNGNILMGGSFTTPSITLGAFTLIGPSTPQYAEMCVVKFSDNGGVIWAGESDGPYYGGHSISSLTTDASGNVFIVGNYNYMSFGSHALRTLSASTQNLYNAGQKLLDPPSYSKTFIACFSKNGDKLFAKGMVGNGNDRVTTVSADNSGNVYVCGGFNGDSITFDALRLDNSKIENVSAYYNEMDLFYAKLNLPVALGITPSNDKDNISLYPNPSTGIFTINLNKPAKSKICIHDVLGNCIMEKEYQNEENLSIDLSNQAKGIYFLEVVVDNKRNVKKVVLQ